MARQVHTSTCWAVVVALLTEAAMGENWDPDEVEMAVPDCPEVPTGVIGVVALSIRI